MRQTQKHHHTLTSAGAFTSSCAAVLRHVAKKKLSGLNFEYICWHHKPDPGIGCRDLAIIPTCTSIPGQQQQEQHQQPALQHFAAPKELFDPRNPIFRELLDPCVHFPALPLDGSSGSSSGDPSPAAVPDVDTAGPGSAILDGLVLCGLRTDLDLEVRGPAQPI